MIIWTIPLLAVVCLFLALVNFAESSITSLSGARLKSLKAVLGHPFGEAARRWLVHPEEYLKILLLVQNILESFYVWLLLLSLSAWIEVPSLAQGLTWVLGTLV